MQPSIPRDHFCRLYIGVFTAPDRDPSVIFQAIYGAVALLNVAAPLGVVLAYGVYSAVLGKFRAGLPFMRGNTTMTALCQSPRVSCSWLPVPLRQVSRGLGAR